MQNARQYNEHDTCNNVSCNIYIMFIKNIIFFNIFCTFLNIAVTSASKSNQQPCVFELRFETLIKNLAVLPHWLSYASLFTENHQGQQRHLYESFESRPLRVTSRVVLSSTMSNAAVNLLAAAAISIS